MNRRAFLASTAGFAVAPQMAAPPASAPGLPQASGAALREADETGFSAWLSTFQAKALAAGLSADFLATALQGLAPDPAVIALDGRQPELSKPISSYLASAVSDGRVAQGRAKLAAIQPLIHAAEDSSGVPADILVAIWGVESSFGAAQGDYSVVRSLATLAYNGRRRDWAEGQLISALRILASGLATPAQLRGSWAGAMGQTQFTPEDYLAYAVDGDHDGRRDIWGSALDALASTANFLAKKAAWRAEQSWAREVVVPRTGFDYSRVEGPKLSPAAWTALDVRPADGRGYAPQDAEETVAALLMPMGWSGPGFLAFPNHYAIRAYNNSASYALAVGVLADRIGGAGPLVQAWPQDQPTSLADRMAAQRALASQGFDPGAIDGVLGAGTRVAARGWQAARGLPADGYLSHALIQRLIAETPTPAPTLTSTPAPAVNGVT